MTVTQIPGQRSRERPHFTEKGNTKQLSDHGGEDSDVKDNQMKYEEPRIEWSEVLVEAGFAVSEGFGNGDGRPGQDWDENEYPDEL